MIYILVFVSVVLLLGFLYTKRFSKPANSPPYIAGAIPYIGKGLEFGKDPVGVAMRLHKEVTILSQLFII